MEGAGGMGRGQTLSIEFYLRNYRLRKTLGIGSFGKVKLAEHVLTKQKVAIKILNRGMIREMDMEEKVIREIEIMRIFMHPHIVRLYEVIETPADIFLVMEVMKCGELFYYITENGRLREDEGRHFFQQIISGVEFCHRNMIVHRDLKPENLLLDSRWNVKIADFGFGNVMRDGRFLKTSCGSHNYAAPEILSGKLYAGPEVDVWSCGVILYALLCGGLPFDDPSLSNLVNKIKGGIYTLPSHLSRGARSLISHMLLVDPMQRATIPEIREHEWFQAHLPRYLAVPPLDNNQQAKRIDDDILQAVVNVGFDRNQLIESLQNRVQNQATVAYYLMRDNTRRISNGYLEAAIQNELEGGAEVAHMEPLVQNLIGRPGPSSGHAPRSLNIHHPASSSLSGLQHRGPGEQKWALALQSKESPRAIMMEVLKTLHRLEIPWKNLGSYRLKCRWVPPVAAPSSVSDSTMPTGSLGSKSPTLSKKQQRVDLQAASCSITTPVTRDSDDCQTEEAHREARSSLTTSVTRDSDDCQTGEAHREARSSLTTSVTRDSDDCQTGEAHREVLSAVKFEIQLYKVREGKYLLDVQRVEGPLLLFLDLYASFSAELRILS